MNSSDLPYLPLQAIREPKAENDALREQVEQLKEQNRAAQEAARAANKPSFRF